ncbi:MAG: hypothetical protein QOE28_2448, partial [Solirubrobacteraceae bacterium]|nr:hypothetical protein [Solirubrobacteraceae bacterium]
GIWICDPVFAIDALREPIEHADAVPATDPGYFAGAQLHAPDLARAAEEERERRATRHERQAQARASNLGFGHDRRAGLLEPSPAQLEAVKTITCRLLARHAGELIALGAGWSEPEHQHPVGERGRREPRSPDTVTAAVLERALAEPDPLRAITGVIAAWASAFALDPDGLPRAGALGAERLERRQADALPAGPGPLRDAVWALLSPLLSPRLIELHRDAFLAECKATSTVDLTAHRGDSALEEIELGQERAA